jgi:hypothetical protein
VDEYIRTVVVGRDEAEALFRVEPLDRSQLGHGVVSPAVVWRLVSHVDRVSAASHVDCSE